MRPAPPETAKAFGLIPAWYSAIVTGLLGTLPGRGFRLRVILVTLVLSAGVALSCTDAHLLFEAILDGVKPPEGTSSGQWAALVLYAGEFTKLFGYVVLVGVAYFIRQGLLPRAYVNNQEHKARI